jgi:lipoic acid synthetase
LRAALPHAAVEVLTPDFRGNRDAVRTVVEARPDYFNHNVETVPRLYDFVRPGSRFERSLAVLRHAKELDPSIVTKSGLMLGLGERRDEVVDVLKHLRENEVEIVTIGQYLQPKREKLDVVEYVHPTVFDEYRAIGEELGFGAVFSGPFVRSSYMADLVAHEHARA